MNDRAVADPFLPDRGPLMLQGAEVHPAPRANARRLVQVANILFVTDVEVR